MEMNATEACRQRLAGDNRRIFRRQRDAGGALLLPGALLVPIGAHLLAAFVLVDFSFAAFFE